MAVSLESGGAAWLDASSRGEACGVRGARGVRGAARHRRM